MTGNGMGPQGGFHINVALAATQLDASEPWLGRLTGTIDGAAVHPREIARRALELNAAAVIFAHNHPSGVAEPSAADGQLTKRLKQALDLFDVRVLDHIIVGDGDQTVSLAERGLF